MHGLMVAEVESVEIQAWDLRGNSLPRPAPLERLKVWVGGELYKLFHESVTVTKSTERVR